MGGGAPGARRDASCSPSRAGQASAPISGADAFCFGWASYSTFAVGQLFAISFKRNGLSTVGAMIAATMFRAAAIMNTAVQLPVALINTLPSGTRSDAVPLAVYNRP